MKKPTRHTILVVDDEPDVVKSVQDLLRLDYRVLGATRAADAGALLENEEVHVVMTDQRMPEMTGVEFLKKVRGDFPDAIRLLFTGYADIRAVIDAINQGNVYRYITKPWDPTELQTVIREACDRYDLLVERQQLLKEVQEKNQELEKANVELKESSELKSAFIQVASHELRTPLTILLGLAKLVSRDPELPDPAKDWMQRIVGAGNRLQHLVDQVVTMLSAEKYERILERESVELAKLVKEAADDVRPFVELRKQSLSINIPEDLGNANVDVMKIRDSLNHLLLNAIKFTPDGGEITVGAQRVEGAIDISVSDNGSGIDEAHMKQLFQPFFTGFDVSHHSSGQFEHGRQGIGLGLSVVKAFVEMHGGSVEVKSQVGQGSTFTIHLPQSAT